MGRGCTMDEWVHFEKLPESGRVPNSSYWYVQCRHCAAGFAQKQLVNPPAKLTGRRTSMKAHLKACPVYAVHYKAEQAAAAAVVKAQLPQEVAVPGGDAATDTVVAETVAQAEDATGASDKDVAVETVAVASGATDGAAAGGEEVSSTSNKRKRKIDADEVIGPRKPVVMLLLCLLIFIFMPLWC